jgi:hypothetical protein
MNINLLRTVVAATMSAGFLMIESDSDANELASAGLIELNTGLTDGNKVAARATAAGNDMANTAPGFENGSNAATSPFPTTATAPQTQPQAEAKPTFERVRMALPAEAPRKPSAISTEEKYPFSELAPLAADGSADMFFVAPTAKIPDPAKSLVSAVSAANRRFAIAIGKTVNKSGKERTKYEFVRKFQIYPSTDANKPGVWIARTDKGDHPSLNKPSNG